MRRYVLLLALFGVFGAAAAYIHEPVATVSAPVMVEENHVLILDAGHGGIDGGTSSSDGVRESEVNLQITCKMYELCHFLGEDVTMTRTGPEALCDANASTIQEKKVSDTQNRVKLINSYPNATLLSIHQNALPGHPGVHGAQVFYSTSKRADELAQYIQERLNKAINPGNEKKIKQIPSSVYIMKHARCPAALIECGFLSNSKETELLQQSNYQMKLATTIMCGYLAYKG